MQDNEAASAHRSAAKPQMVAAGNESSPKSYIPVHLPTNPFVSSNWLLQPYVWIGSDVPQVQVGLAAFDMHASWWWLIILVESDGGREAWE